MFGINRIATSPWIDHVGRSQPRFSQWVRLHVPWTYAVAALAYAVIH